MKLLYAGVLIMVSVLAILSRKHFSKYKGKGIFTIFWAISEYLILKFGRKRCAKRLEMAKSQGNIFSVSRLKGEIKKYYVDGLSYCLIAFFATTIISAGLYLTKEKTPDSAEIVIERQDYDGNDISSKLNLSYEDKETTYELSVAKRKYTMDEFMSKAYEVCGQIEKEMLGDNLSAEKIHTNLNLVAHDKDKVFDIIWKSESPNIISSSGILRDEAQTGDEVVFRVRVEYYDYFYEKKFNFIVDRSSEAPDANFQAAITAIEKMEDEQSTSDELRIPAEIGGINVSMATTESNAHIFMLLMGIVLVVLIIMKRKQDEKENMLSKNHMLINKYPEFVNHIWLFLGTGMNVKTALEYYAEECDGDSVLSDEIRYSINLINSGINEASVYEELGQRLGINEYSRIFMHISQNLRMGTKDIRNIMEEELLNASILRKEQAKKRGEEASTKLLAPMGLLLIVTMMIIIVPALLNF